MGVWQEECKGEVRCRCVQGARGREGREAESLKQGKESADVSSPGMGFVHRDDVFTLTSLTW